MGNGSLGPTSPGWRSLSALEISQRRVIANFHDINFMANKNQPPANNKNKLLKTTPEKLGAAAFGLAVATTLAPALVLGLAAGAGTTAYIRKKKAEKAKKNKNK